MLLALSNIANTVAALYGTNHALESAHQLQLLGSMLQQSLRHNFRNLVMDRGRIVGTVK